MSKKHMPMNLESVLADIVYPAAKIEILTQADEQGASKETMKLLQKLPIKNYNNVNEITAELNGYEENEEVFGLQPPQHQDHQPGLETLMYPPPHSFMEDYKPAGKLEGKVALISGGDSGIGRAISIAFAKEGADIAFIYLEEDEDARETEEHVTAEGRKCLTLRGDITDPGFCQSCVEDTIREFGQLDVLVNNAAEQHVCEKLEEITPQQLQRTFATNVFGTFYLTQAALPHLKEKAAIINTVSITAYQGQAVLMDYAATKGALLALTRSLSANLVKKGIRVNGVAPGPVWTPLIPASFEAEQVSHFGEDTPMGRPGQPDEIAPAYVFLASGDSSYMTGQVLHPNGGTIIAG